MALVHVIQEGPTISSKHVGTDGVHRGLPKKIASRRVYLTRRQVDRLAKASGDNATLIRTLAYTGMRWAEVTGFRVQAIDFGRSRIWVTQSAVEVGGEFFEGTPKSHKIRGFPLPPLLRTNKSRTAW